MPSTIDQLVKPVIEVCDHYDHPHQPHRPPHPVRPGWRVPGTAVEDPVLDEARTSADPATWSACLESTRTPRSATSKQPTLTRPSRRIR